MMAFLEWLGRGGFRLGLGVVGVVLLGIAVVWAGEKPADAVILAIIGVGTVLLYLSYSGQLLTTLKAGGVEGTFAQVVDAIDNPRVPGEVKEQVERIVQRGQAPIAVRQQVREFSAAHRRARSYEDEVGKALTRLKAKGQNGWVVEKLASGGPFDFKVVATGVTVRVECRWAAGVPDERLFERWKVTAADQGGGALGEGILLVASDLPPSVSGLPPASPLRRGVVAWKSRAEDGDLERAIQTAFR